MHLKIAVLDGDAGPNPRDQFLLAHELAWALEQNNQDIESATPEAERFVSFEEEPLPRA
jgi:hypothetical protein